MSTAAVDLTKMSAAEIKAFIEAQNASTEPTEQPRDEQGRFVSPQADPVEDPQADPVEETEPVVVEREIDLADGSGVQVFRGVGATKEEAYEALADEFAKAQEHATKKIKELSHGAQPAAQPNPPAPVVDEAHEFLLAQQLMDKPKATLDKLRQEWFAEYEAKQQAKANAAAEKDRQEGLAADAFIAANPEFHPCPENAEKIDFVLTQRGLKRDADGLQRAYNELKASRLLVTEAAPDPDTVSNRPRSSGLSTRSTSSPPPPKAVDTSKLTTEQLRELAGGYQAPRF